MSVIYVSKDHYDDLINQINVLQHNLGVSQGYNNQLFGYHQNLYFIAQNLQHTVHVQTEQIGHITEAVGLLGDDINQLQRTALKLAETNQVLTTENQVLKMEQNATKALVSHITADMHGFGHDITKFQLTTLKLVERNHKLTMEKNANKALVIHVKEAVQEVANELSTLKATTLKSLSGVASDIGGLYVKKQAETKLAVDSSKSDEKPWKQFLVAAESFKRTMSANESESERRLNEWYTQFMEAIKDSGALLQDVRLMRGILEQDPVAGAMMDVYFNRPDSRFRTYDNLKDTFKARLQTLKSLKTREKKMQEKTKVDLDNMMKLLT